jgi:hypothetical protein
VDTKGSPLLGLPLGVRHVGRGMKRTSVTARAGGTTTSCLPRLHCGKAAGVATGLGLTHVPLLAPPGLQNKLLELNSERCR